MQSLHFSMRWAVLPLLLGTAVFWINHGWFYGDFPLYRLWLAPGTLALQFFSEELFFWPKLAVLLCGQYLFSAVTVYICHWLWCWKRRRQT